MQRALRTWLAAAVPARRFAGKRQSVTTTEVYTIAGDSSVYDARKARHCSSDAGFSRTLPL